MNLFEEWEEADTRTGRSGALREGRNLDPVAALQLPAKSVAPRQSPAAAAAGAANWSAPPANANPFANDDSATPSASASAPILTLKHNDIADILGGAPRAPVGGPVAVVAAAVSNNVVVLGTSAGRVVRWKADGAAEADETEIPRAAADAIHKVFVDPTGFHAVVAMASGDSYYMHARTSRPRKLAKWHGNVVEAIAFDRQRGTEGSTKQILIGTRGGDIFESSLDNTGKDKPLTHLYTLAHNQAAAAARGGGFGHSGGGGGGGGGGGSGSSSGTIPVSDLHFETLNSAVHGESRIYVLVATASPTRLYSFAGGPTFEVLFREYRDSGAVSFLELPGSLPSADLRFFTTPAHSGGSEAGDSGSSGSGGGGGSRGTPFNRLEPPTSLAICTAFGVYHGNLVFGNAQAMAGSGGGGAGGGSAHGLEGIVRDAQLLPFADAPLVAAQPRGTAAGTAGKGVSQQQPQPQPPLSMALTEYHFVLLFPSRIEVVSRLSGNVVQTEALDARHGHSLGLGVDAAAVSAGAAVVGPKLWLWTDRGPTQILVQAEDRDVWRLYLDRALAGDEKQFDAALRRCHDATERAQVHYAHGNYLQRCGRDVLAARHWAQAPGCFEEAALKLFSPAGGGGGGGGSSYDVTGSAGSADAATGLGSEEALKVYLLDKLEQMSRKPGPGGSKMQRTMLCTWLTEIYLHSFIYLGHGGHGGSGGSGGSDAVRRESAALTAEFRQFLKKYAAALNPATTCALLSSHDRPMDLLYYAELIEDYERILSYHMAGLEDGGEALARTTAATATATATPADAAAAALDVLRRAPFEKVEGLIYRHSARLMDANPAQTVRTWMDRPQLRPTKLIPALVRYSESQRAARRARRAVAAAAAAANATADAGAGLVAPAANKISGSSGGGGSSVNRRFGEDTDEDWAVKYLEYCVDVLRQTDPATHNHLLTLYAQAEADAEEEAAASAAAAAAAAGEGAATGPLTLSGKGKAAASAAAAGAAAGGAGSSGSNSSALLRCVTRPPERRFFDLQYALRVCRELRRTRACVHLYSATGLYSEAVELALTIDLALAKKNADLPTEPEVRRRLWLMVARHVVQRRGGEIRDAIAVLSECDLLRIEDILPFFPDFAVIDAFKAEICASLQGYNSRIEGLRREMDEYAAGAAAMQEEVATLRRRSAYVSSAQTCELCGSRVLSTQFYLFPCAHSFHFQCLLDHVRPHLSPEQRKAVDGLLEKLGRGEMPPPPLPTQAASLAGGLAGNANARPGGLDALPAVDASLRAAHYQRAVQSELDGYLGAECALCGDLMIRSVQTPLIGPGEDDEAAQW